MRPPEQGTTPAGSPSPERTLALMRATLESTADGILVVNEDGTIETYNENFAEMWGLAPIPEGTAVPEADILRVILDQLVSPEAFLGGVRELYSRSDDELLDVLHCKDGRIFERFSRPQRLGGNLTGRVWSFRDITDRIRAESALRESEERFRALAELSPVGIFSTDREGRLRFVNERWRDFSGRPLDAARAEGWIESLHPDDRERVVNSWRAAVRDGTPWNAEYRFVRPDESITWLVGQARPQLDVQGRITGFVGTATDVTNLKRAEEERKKIDAHLRQSSKMESLGTLAGGIAHDFNNILTGTFGFVDLARLELNADHPAVMWLDKIASSSQRARDLVRQILVFSRKGESARVPLRLNESVNDGVKMLRSMLPPMVALESRIEADTPTVLADPTQIHQLILNLCTNALQALPPKGGRIAITLDVRDLTAEQAAMHPDLRAGRWVRLSIGDNGCGMDAATLEHIFEPFFTTRETGTGTGLGLSVVHGIMQSHEGAIVVQSAVGVGSTFDLYFPPLAPQSPTSRSHEQVPVGRNERVIVVDDDGVSGFAIEKLVETLGYRVQRFVHPEEALQHLQADPHRCDLVITDLAMPGMNGAELTEHLVRLRPDLPIVVITGYIEPARLHALEGSAARAVLQKPVSREELARVLAEHVARHDSPGANQS